MVKKASNLLLYPLVGLIFLCGWLVAGCYIFRVGHPEGPPRLKMRLRKINGGKIEKQRVLETTRGLISCLKLVGRAGGPRESRVKNAESKIRSISTKRFPSSNNPHGLLEAGPQFDFLSVVVLGKA